MNILPKYLYTTCSHLEKLYLKTTNYDKNYKIGVLVSGGIDSSLLYYLLLLENSKIECPFQVTPYTILRKEGSTFYAKKVINYIQRMFDLPETELNLVGNNQLPEFRQVDSGIDDVLKTNDFVYLGIIKARSEHLIGWIEIKFIEGPRIKYPFLNLEKNQIIDLYYEHNLKELLELAYSCVQDEITPCQTCNGCRERMWGIQHSKYKIF